MAHTRVSRGRAARSPTTRPYAPPRPCLRLSGRRGNPRAAATTQSDRPLAFVRPARQGHRCRHPVVHCRQRGSKRARLGAERARPSGKPSAAFDPRRLKPAAGASAPRHQPQQQSSETGWGARVRRSRRGALSSCDALAARRLPIWLARAKEVDQRSTKGRGTFSPIEKGPFTHPKRNLFTHRKGSAHRDSVIL